jgi:hypothetical protein
MLRIVPADKGGMRVFLILIVVVGLGYWWQHHTPAPQAAPAVPAPVAAAQPAPAAPVQAAPAPAGTGQASWPRRNIDRAQAAVNAAKQTREGL